MTVGEPDRKSLGIVDLLVEAVDVDVVVSAGFHLRELECLLFGAHMVDVDKLGARL